MVRFLAPAAILLLVMVAGVSPPRPAGPDSTAWKALRDSLLALPDSLLAPDLPGLDRQAVVEWMRRMARSPESTYVGPDRAHLTDAEMVRALGARRRDFDRLVRMFEADSTLDAVSAPGWSFYRPPSPLPAKRMADYDSLFVKLGVKMLVRERPTRLILLRTTTVHTFDRKGYAYSRRRLAPLVTGETTADSSGAFRVFKRIGDGWYIYYQPMS